MDVEWLRSDGTRPRCSSPGPLESDDLDEPYCPDYPIEFAREANSDSSNSGMPFSMPVDGTSAGAGGQEGNYRFAAAYSTANSLLSPHLPAGNTAHFNWGDPPVAGASLQATMTATFSGISLLLAYCFLLRTLLKSLQSPLWNLQSLPPPFVLHFA